MIQISNCQQFAAIPDNSFDEYELINDIDCKNVVIKPVSILRTFEGNNFEIKNAEITTSYVTGLFSVINSTSIIKNLKISDSTIKSFGDNYSAGVFAGYLYGMIINCFSYNNTVIGNQSGGFVGQNNGTIANCTSEGNNIKGLRTGGFSGEQRGNIHNCTSRFNRIGDIQSQYMGGITGLITGNTPNYIIQQCVSHDNYISNSYASYAGGIVGYLYGNPIDCLSYNNIIQGYTYVGGIAGRVDCYYNGSVSINNTLSGNSYVGGVNGFLFGYSGHGGSVSINNTISCTATSAGGIMGYADQFTNITNCTSFNNIISGPRKVGGLIGDSNWIDMKHCNSSNNYIFGDHMVGGIAGSSAGKHSFCVSENNIVAGNTSVGGFVGEYTMTNGIYWSQSYNNTVIANITNAGGFIGTNAYSSSLNTSYLIGGRIEGNGNIGGLVGSATTGSYISFCFAIDVNVTSYSENGLAGGLMGNRSKDYNSVTFSYYVGKTYVGDNDGRPLLGGGSDNNTNGYVKSIFWDSTVFPDAKPLIKDAEKGLTTEQFISGENTYFGGWTSPWCFEKGKFPYLSENCPSKRN